MIFTSFSSWNVKAAITVRIDKHHNLPQVIHFFDIYKYKNKGNMVHTQIQIIPKGVNKY